MNNLNTNQWFLLATVFAFLSIISFFNIDSALADEKNLNTAFLVSGIFSGTISLWCLFRAKGVSN